jgi:hypothetical protein
MGACSTPPDSENDDDDNGGSGPTGGVSGTPNGGTATGGAPLGGAAGAATGGSLGGTAGTGFSGGAGASSGTAGVGTGGSGGMVGGAGGVGGAVPQGGDAGMGGAGTSGAAGTAGASGGTGGMATGFLIETFESGTVGQQPAGWDNFIAYIKNGQNPNGTALALVDETRAHGGTKSVKIHGGQQPAMIVKALPANTTRLYVRAWVYNSRQLGMVPNANHETLIGIRGTSGSANNEVRFGEIKGVIGTNEVPTDNISPKMDRWGMGPVIPANTWACIEVAFLGDLPTHELRAWHNGMLVHEVTSSGADQWQNGAMPSMTWMNGKFTEVILGWQSFTGGQAEVDIWMDDIILSNSAIGCN